MVPVPHQLYAQELSDQVTANRSVLKCALSKDLWISVSTLLSAPLELTGMLSRRRDGSGWLRLPAVRSGSTAYKASGWIPILLSLQSLELLWEVIWQLILTHPSADSGSQESINKCTPVPPNRSMAKKSFKHTSLLKQPWQVFYAVEEDEYLPFQQMASQIFAVFISSRPCCYPTLPDMSVCFPLAAIAALSGR